MNPVGELLSIHDIALGVDVSSKAGLLQRVALMLAQRAGVTSADVLAGLTAREELGSTALGHGVAIPHARMPQCGASAGVFVRTKFGIDFDAPDRRPVSMFLGLIVPKQANERHLKLLAAAATMFSDRAFRERLMLCSDSAGASRLLAAWPDFSLEPQLDKPAVP
ncbi:MAG TPA: PTS sugar transporter subunit IIA [Casimicrobiaceae bacterium]|nr:PTS sugar transporter subunit IIA [Casimicrobiaceae bacterium]